MVRVRFAPSPTGYLHIGGVRTALYNYLFARNQKGRFVLRIEDTDRSRFVQDAESYIAETLRWLDIEPDESPWHGGEFGPYRQSERTEQYQYYVQQILASGKAYYAFDTESELEEMRQRMKAAGVANPQYNAASRMHMRNALTLPPEEVQALLKSKHPCVVRLKVPSRDTIRFYDRVRGWIKVQTSTLDDKVLLKSDGLPTYHFASVVDDHLMQISHVIRGEEWIPSTPTHVLLYQSLGWHTQVPEFVHLPLLLKPEGTGKLSKRDAEQYGFPVFPLSWRDAENKQWAKGFRQEGYLPEALLNFLALLGWSPKGEHECLSRQMLTEAFDLHGVGKAGVKFDIRKAGWFNQQHLRAQSDTHLTQYLRKPLEDLQIRYSEAQLLSVVALVKERTVFPKDFWHYGKCFFVAPKENITVELKAEERASVLNALACLSAAWNQAASFTESYIEGTFEQSAQQTSLKTGRLMQAVRSALTGLRIGAELVPTVLLLGAQESVVRLQRARNVYAGIS